MMSIDSLPFIAQPVWPRDHDAPMSFNAESIMIWDYQANDEWTTLTVPLSHVRGIALHKYFSPFLIVFGLFWGAVGLFTAYAILTENMLSIGAIGLACLGIFIAIFSLSSPFRYKLEIEAPDKTYVSKCDFSNRADYVRLAAPLQAYCRERGIAYGGNVP
jgi:hypothetical protein